MIKSKQKIKDKIYYHGTNHEAALRIAKEGFRVGRIGLDDEGDPIVIGSGNLGAGTYITPDWRIALFFGNVILQVELKPGTKILNAAEPPDTACLDHLRREFGKDILGTAPLHTLLPRNKRLTLPEVISLLRYHYSKTDKFFWSGKEYTSTKIYLRKSGHLNAMHRLGRYLQRFGYSGFGDPLSDNGIVIFQPDKLKPVAVEAILNRRARVYVDPDGGPGGPEYPQIKSLEHLCEICKQFEDDEQQKIMSTLTNVLSCRDEY